jgi:glyoxylase I family protein
MPFFQILQMNQMVLIKGIHHIAIICSDYHISKQFYTEKLGFKILAENYRSEKRSWKLDLVAGDRTHIELFSFGAPPVRPSNPEAAGLRHLAFAVENIEAAVETLKLKGIVFEELRIDEYTGKKFIFFADPDNLPLELYEV